MKKFVNILTLIIMVSVNFMTPFTYAQVGTQEVDVFQETENFDENNEENSDEIKTSDASGEDDENAEIEDSEDNSSDIEEKLEDFETAGGDEQEPEINTGDNEQEPEINTGDNEQEPEINTGDNEQEPEANTGDNEQGPEINTGDNEQEPEASTGDNEQEPEINTELWEQGEDFYDIIYTGIVRGREYTITFMDRNLGALTTDTQEEDSYGYYYQWGNSYPFSHHTQLNQYTMNQVDASGYGPDNRYRGENFIKGHEDWSSASNSNLWGGGLDSIENDYNDESDRQGPCPEGYHVPSVGEWHALFSCFLVNNGISEATTDGLEYPNYIGKERHAAYYLGSEDIEKFKSTFNISYAGRIKQDGSVDRTGEMTHFWTSTPMNNIALGFEVWDDRINLGGWKTARSTGYPVRCFKSVEYELVDYTVTYLEDENEIIETKHWGDVLTEPEHTDKGEGYNRLGWFSRGVKFDFSTPITGDITLVATWGCSNDYHIEDGLCKPNTKTVNCKQIGGVENSAYIVTGMEITRDITGGKWEEIPTCDWKCLEDYHLTGGQCESNTKTVECVQTGGVENSTYIVTGVVIVWDITGGVRNETPACEWKCNVHHHLSGDACDIDRFMFTLVENAHVNTSGSTETGKKPYDSKIELSAESHEGYRFLGWQILGLNGTGTSHISVSSEVVFNMPDRNVTATPLSETIEYKIVYRNVDDAIVVNPTTYTIETETFTLNEPLKTGYVFLGWTGSNGSTPDKNVTITKGTTGNKRYTAVWEPMSGINYQVVHAVEKPNSTTYDVRETEILSGTTDEMTQAVAKEYTGFTAKEITQKVIKGDGSTVVRVQYQRNIYTITFDSNGGSEILPITGKYESNLTAPSNPTKKGYIFNGWKPSFPSTMPLSGAELVAQWRRPSGGGSSSSEETQVTTGTNNETTGKVEEIVEEVQNLDIDAGTSIAPMVMRSMKLGSMMLRSVGPEIIEPDLPIEDFSDMAVLLPGSDFNAAIRTLAGDSDPGNYQVLDTAIIQVLYWTGNTIPLGVTTGLISENYSDADIVAWFDNGIIYYYTEADKIYLNEDSSYMFESMTNLVKIDTFNWDTSNVTDMNHMFDYCWSLTDLDVSNWDTSNVIDMGDMFWGCIGFTSLDLSNWDTSSVENMHGMFSHCNYLQTIYASTGFVTTAVENSTDMFDNDTRLVGGNGTVYDSSKTDKTYARIDASGTPGYFTDGATCGVGYVKHGIGCELINVTFDANGGSFLTGGSIKTVDTTVTEILPIRYSHTSNVDDSGVASSIYANNLSVNDVVTISGATSLDIEVRFSTESASYDWLAIYPTGITPTSSNYSSATISNGKLAGHGSYLSYTKPNDADTTYHRTFSSSGDSAQFYFKSDGSAAYYGYYAIIKGIGATINYECAYDIGIPVREGYFFDGWYTDTGFTQRFDVLECLSSNTTVYAKWYQPQPKDIVIEATATGANQTLKINKYFANAYTVHRGDGTTGNLTADTEHTYASAGTYTIVLSPSTTRWTFQNVQKPLIPIGGTTMTGVKIIYMPSLAEGFGANATKPGNYFFYSFNREGKLISLPEGSFDTSKITTVGTRFFSNFNRVGQLTNLPTGSFRLSTGLTTAGSDFFQSFNYQGKLINLPEGSFDIGNIKTVGDGFFIYFNYGGALTSLPVGSFDTSNITKVGNNFFAYFNNGGALINLPGDSFDTSKITTVGNNFFSYFNDDGALTSLPVGSFNLSGITTVGNAFFSSFNSNGALTSLPVGSFNTSNITKVGNDFFAFFNTRGALTSLPVGSFDTSKITSVGNDFYYCFNAHGSLTSLPENSFRLATGLTTVGNYFFYDFNGDGALTSLPEGSFNTSNITKVGREFFREFNYDSGQLTSLPEGSFDISNITTGGDMFFYEFNSNGALTSLPVGSFRLATGLTIAERSFFSYFNSNGALTSLPVGSFNLSGITTVGDNFFSYFNSNGALTSLPVGSFRLATGITTVGGGFFSYFNSNGALTSLPVGSFNLSGITTVGDSFFSYFNSNGALTSLPVGSFNLSGITTVGSNFFYYFNNNGKLTNLPDSFKLTSAAYNKTYAYKNAFKSSNYTINRKVSDLVAGIENLAGDQDVFSDNQPGRCGVHENWLVSKANACSITYNSSGGSTITNPTKKYDADITGVVAGAGITLPTKAGYTLSGWYTQSGEVVNEVRFPEMDGQTLYAGWIADNYTIAYNLNGGTESLPNPTTYTLESGNIQINRPTRTGYMFMGWRGSNGSNPDPDIVILSGSTGNKTYNAIWLPFDDLNIYTVSNTGNITHHTIMDRNMGATSTNISSSDSYGSYYKWGNNQGYAGNASSWTSISVGTWTKGEQGPCPDGYHVPEKSDLVGLGFDWARSMGITPPASEIDVLFQNNTLFDLIKHDFLVSLGGGKGSNNGALYGTNEYVGWHSSEQYSQTNDYIFRFSQEGRDRLFKVGSTNKNSGYPVRCFKNSPISRDLTIYPNGGTGAVIVFTGEVGNGKIITLGTPKKANSVFGGWYSNAELTTSVTIGSTVPVNLYARWSCNTGYVQNIAGDGCTKVYTIAYNLNGGIETTANPTSYTVESGTFGLYQPTKTGAMFLGWTGSNGNTVNANIYITQGSTGNRTYNAVWGTYEDIDAYFISNTGAVSNITLMDRNLGAISDDIISTGSYGFHYQRGNNHGFQIGCWTNNCSDSVTTNATTTKAIWDYNYDNKGYNGTVFVKATSQPYDYWSDSILGNDNHFNLRGGGSDEVSNHWGTDTMTTENIINRQGPCPEGYHVPSIGEWNNLLKYRVSEYTGNGNTLSLNAGGSSQLNYFSDSVAREKFQQDFDIVFAGHRYRAMANIENQGVEAYLWSSSTSKFSNSEGARFLKITMTDVLNNYNIHRALGHPVRCFSNDYMFSQPSMNVVPNGGTGAMILVEGGNVKSLGTPKRGAHSIFEGWYDADSGGNRIQTGSTAPSNLYARWDCDTGYLQNLSGTACELGNVVTFDANRGTFVANQIILSGQKAITPADPQLPGYTFGGWYTNTGLTTLFNFSTPITGDITLYAKWTYNFTITDLNVYFVESDGSIEYSIIMDRNLGATAIYNGNYSNPNTTSYGYYFQWGNNYGFANAGSVSDQSAKIPFNVWSAYIPSKYAKNIFVKGNNSWMNESTPTDNLWGGESSDVLDRQGPCPDGYHIPTTGEWLNLYNYRDNAKTLTLSLGYQWASDFLMPLAGLRGYSRAQLEDQKYDGYYWAANASSLDYAYHFGFYSSLITPNREYSRANGTSVRCFKNNQTSVMNIYPDGGTGAIITFTGKIVKLGIPKRAGYFFDGWYSTSGFAAGSEVGIGDDVPINLYAKWLEYFQEYQVDFLANGGEFSDGTSSQTRLYVYNSGTNSYVISGYLSLPNRTGYMFDGWYTDTGYTTERMGTNEEIMLGSIHTLYAKWLSFNDLAIDFGDNVIYIMDRNLGASDIASGTNPYYQPEDITKLGKYYQWGNNFGFGNLGNLFEVDDKRVNADEYNVNNKSYYDTTFHTSSISPYSRTLNNNTNLWGGDMMVNTENEQEYKQGPCPIGYHVPDIREWTALSDLYGEWRLSEAGQSFCNNKGYGECFTIKLKLPNAGYRDHGNSTLSNVGNIGFYRSVSPYGDGGFYSYSLGLDKSRLDPTLDTPRALGLSVRCMKNSDDVTIMFNSMGGSEVASLTQKWYIPMLGGISPTRANSEFDGWYLNTGYQDQFVGYTTTNKTLYAKWKCDFGYVQNSDQTACEPIAVNFDANGGIFSGGQEIISVMPDIDTESVFITKYSHTPNISDDGTQNGNYGNNISTNEVITITGADTLHVTITYATEGTTYDWAVVRAGSHPEYTAYSDYGTSVSGKLGGTIKKPVEYDIPGDTVTFGFRSDVSVNNYGYYAVVTGTGTTSSIAYSGNAFVNVEEPTRTGYTFTGWYLDTGYQNQFDPSNISTGVVTNVYARWEDNVNPTVSADKDGVWWTENITITLSVIDDNLNYAKYSWTSAGDCVSSGTSFASGDTITYTIEGTGTLYLCASDRAGNTATWSGVYYLDKTRPAITFDQQSGASANSHSVEITATDMLSKLVQGADGYTVTYSGKSYTLASSDLPGYYYRGNNVAGDGTPYVGVENNDRWGGGGDTETNGYDSGNPRSERQGPCPEGWHVPSKGEWKAIITAWCHLDSNSCTSSEISAGDSYINNSTLGSAFKTFFGLTNGSYWSSSPIDIKGGSMAELLDVFDYGAYIDYPDFRDSFTRVRCLKDSTSAGESSTLKYRWQTDSTCSSDESDYTSKSRDSFDASNTTATATVTTEGLDDGSYYLCVLSGSAVDNAGNTNVTTKTSGQFIVDNTAPIGGTFTINNGAEYTNSTSVKLNTTCPTDAGNGTVQVAYGNSTNPTNWTTCSSTMDFTLPSGDGEKTIYMRFRDGLGNTTDDVTDTIILDTTKPVCMWGEPSKSLIRGGQTGQIVLTCIDNVGIADDLPSIDETTIGNILIINYPEIGGTLTGRTYTYIYTGKMDVNGQESFWLDHRYSIRDIAGNIPSGVGSSEIAVDNTAPIITFDQESGASANSHSVEITATDNLSKLVGESPQPSGGDERNTATYSSGVDGYTVTYNGKSYTLASSNLPGTYNWGNNIARNNMYYGGEESYDRWGGGGDTYENGFNPTPDNFEERQGPCDEGWHVPSRGEWNAIVIAWCHLDTNDCTSSDLQHENRMANNNLIYISNSTLASAFKTSFGMINDYYWSSSHSNGGSYYPTYFRVNNRDVGSDDDVFTFYTLRSVRCLKNSTSVGGSSTGESSTLKYRWQTDSTCSSDESDYTSKSRDSFDASNTTATATVTTEGLDDGNYYLCVLSGSAVDNAGNTNITTKTSGQFIVDNSAPINGSFTINNGVEYTNNANVRLNTTCPTDAGNGTVQVAYGSSADPTNWKTCSSTMDFTLPSGDGEKTVYMRFRDGLGNTTDNIIDTIILDKTPPVCTWGEPSKSLIRGGQTGTIVLTCTDNIGMSDGILIIDDTTFYDILDISDFETGGTVTGIMYTYTYTGKPNANGQAILYVDTKTLLRDMAGNRGSEPGSSEIIVDNTPPILNADKSSNSRYTGDINITLSVSDANGLNYSKYSRTSANDCVNNGTNFASGATITDNVEGNRTLYLCAEDNAGNTATWTGTYKLDTEDPVCGTWSYEPPLNIWTNTSVTATLAGSTDATAGIQIGGGNCSISTNNATCDVTISDKAGRTTVCTSSGATNIDFGLPTATITTTSTLKTGSQTATLSCGDNVGVTSYYWGTNVTPLLGDYTNVTSTTSFTTTKNVTSAGTYYLYCKDAAGNISTGASQTYYSYTVHNMQNAIDKSEGAYNTTNYPEVTTYTKTYIASAGTTITFANVYTVPTYSAVNQYKGWSSSASTTAPTTSESETLNGNKTYYFWFDRTKYNLTLTKNTGIARIYYKVNGAASYSNTTTTKIVTMKAGSTAYVYAAAANGYTYTATSSSKPQTYSTVTEDKIFSPVATLNTYTITYNLNGGTNDASNPTIYTVTSGNVLLNRPVKDGYMFMGWTGSNGNGANPDVVIPSGSYGNKTYNAVWLGFDDLELYFLKDNGGIEHYTIMDRNMGATEPYNQSFTIGGVNTESFGYHYQRGNNYGFAPCIALGSSCNTFPGGESTIQSKVTVQDVYMPSKYARNTFYYYGGRSRNSQNWYSNNGQNLWGNTTNTLKARQGPCPEGYYVPSAEYLQSVLAKWKSSTLNPSNGIQFAYDLLLPPAGHRGYLDGEQGGDYRVRFQGIYANLQTSYQNGYISASSTNVFYGIDGEGSMIAFSVRCMKNTNNSDTLTLHPNGGTKAVIAFTGDVGNGKFTALGTPIRDSHSIFEGWYSTSNFAAGTQVIKGSVVPADLYAKWSCDTGYVETIAGDGCTKIYTITYNLNGGTNNANNPAKYTVESGAITLQSPTKVGYTFLGWTGSNGSIPQTSVTIPTGSTGDRIYDAVWQANTYKISYTMNGGTNCGTAPTTATYDTPFTVCNNPTKVGYTFAGWKITGMDSVIHTYGSSTTTNTSISSTKETNFKNLHSTSGATVTFEALWTINQYNVTVSVSPEGWGGIDNNISGKYDYGFIVEAPSDVLYIRNVACGGAYAKRPPQGICNYTTATPTISTAQYTYGFSGWNNECGDTVTHDCEITAEFTRTLNSYDVTFNSNGGTPVATQNINYGSKVTRPSDPIRTGYAFAGWRLNGSDFDFNMEITGAITLVAKWNLVGYTIIYNLNGGTESLPNPTTYTTESETITLHQPTRVGYTFGGWTGSNGTTPQTSVTIPSGSTGNRIYNAVWQANTNTPYTVYHYVKKVGSGTYELVQTEPKQGTSDAILVLSSLAKANGFVCATYDKGSLTGTASGPGEIVTQTTINGDGSTKIYLYYNRNKRTVHLTGDDHVDILKINGEESDNAVLECGSEVPVNAIPKPGYHFVRWDREEREGREDDEIDTHSGGTND